MQWLHVAYNFGCRVLYNPPWRASVSSNQVQYNIPIFEALIPKYKYLFVKRCRKSNNIWLHASMQTDCMYSSLYFEEYNSILLCEWVLEHCSVCLIDGMSCHTHSHFTWISTLSCSKCRQGRRQTFSFGGASFATRGAVNGLCRTFRKRPEKFWGATGGPGKILGGQWPSLAPPSSAPGVTC